MLGRMELEVDCSFASDRICGQGYLKDLSLAGARLVAPPSVGQVGEFLTLMLEPPKPHPPLGLTARIVRVDPIEEELAYGLQFQGLPPTTRDELTDLLRGLSRRPSPAADGVPRVELRCATEEAVRRIFGALARGTLATATGQPVVAGAEVLMRVGVEAHPQLLELSARVEEVNGEQLSLSFKPVDALVLDRIEKLLGVLLGLGVRQAVLEDED